MRPWDDRFEAVLRSSLPLLGAAAEITPETSLRDAGLDSMKIVTIVVGLEDAYGGTFPDSELTFDAFATPAELWALVARSMPTAVGEN